MLLPFGSSRDRLLVANHSCLPVLPFPIGFFFADFPYVDNDCRFKVANLFAVDIDLDTKRFVKAKLDDEILTAKEAVILLWFNTSKVASFDYGALSFVFRKLTSHIITNPSKVAAQHVKLHAMANWGTNVDDSLDSVNSFLRQNSVVTTMYNFFGYTSFSGFLSIWAKQGLLSNGWADPHMPLVKCFNHGIKDNVYQHAQIESLVKHSRFVKVRETIAFAPSISVAFSDP